MPRQVAPHGYRVPPHAYFVVSAVFHYLGPAFAVLLFAALSPLGVAWLRIVSAALVFAAWRRPWRRLATMAAGERWLLVALGLVLAGMNSVFYLAIARLPLATVGAIEFLGPIVLAAAGLRGRRNLAALGLAVAGVALLTEVRLAAEPLGLGLAFANAALFMAYIVLGKRIAARSGTAGIDRLGLAMLVAAAVIAPVAFLPAAPAFGDPGLLAAGVAVGLCSSVIPYVCDQLAFGRLPRASFALLLSLLPATATAIGMVVLGQRPGLAELSGIALVICGVACHAPEERKPDGVRPAGHDRPAGLEDLPGHDELRPPERAVLAPHRGRGRAAGQAGGGGGRQLLRHRRHV